MNTDTLIPVEGHPDLYRDPVTNAIINTNKSALQKFKDRRTAEILKDKKIEQMSEELEELKLIVSSIVKNQGTRSTVKKKPTTKKSTE